MNRPIVVALLALIALTRLHGAAGFEADIPFEFHAGKQILPPGTYSFLPNDPSNVVSVTRINRSGTIDPTSSVHDVLVPVITRLGARSTSDEGTLVFDKVGDLRTLSEIWIPLVDGFLLNSIPEKHGHEFVRVVTRGTQLPKDQ